MVSLQSVDAEFSAVRQGWHRAMQALHERSLVSWQHLYDSAVLWCFGRLIHNTDMHLGNLSLGIDGDVFRILPVYDMCSMGFAPKGGEVQPYRFDCPELGELGMFEPKASGEIKTVATTMARDFWNRVAGDRRISSELRQFLAAGNPVDRASKGESPQLDLL